MPLNLRQCAIAVLTIAGAVIVATVGMQWRSQRQWFDLQARQLATIERLANFPPAGMSPDTWRNALVTPYNVWGNVTFHPSSSHITNEEMGTLQRELDVIVRETTEENGFDSVDRVFELLMRRGQKTEFIAGYREEFRSLRDAIPQRSLTANRSPTTSSDSSPMADGKQPPAAR